MFNTYYNHPNPHRSLTLFLMTLSRQNARGQKDADPRAFAGLEPRTRRIDAAAFRASSFGSMAESLNAADRRTTALRMLNVHSEGVRRWLESDRAPSLLDCDPAWEQLAMLLSLPGENRRSLYESWAVGLNDRGYLGPRERRALNRRIAPAFDFATLADCPWCGSAEGAPCVSEKGGALKRPHEERVDLVALLCRAEVPPEALEVVGRGKAQDHRLDLACGRLGALFAPVRQLVGAAGGRWIRGDLFAFPPGVSAEERVRALLARVAP